MAPRLAPSRPRTTAELPPPTATTSHCHGYAKPQALMQTSNVFFKEQPWDSAQRSEQESQASQGLEVQVHGGHRGHPRYHATEPPSASPSMEVASVPKKPMVLWCSEGVCFSNSLGRKTSEYFPQVAFLHFTSAVMFARWMFEQPRGAVMPHALLVVSWRTAKPCASAITAARTGRIGKLRLDDQRVELQQVVGRCSKTGVKVCIDCIIIALGPADGLRQNWSQDESIRNVGCPVGIARGAEHLFSMLGNWLRQCRGQSVQPTRTNAASSSNIP